MTKCGHSCFFFLYKILHAIYGGGLHLDLLKNN